MHFFIDSHKNYKKKLIFINISSITTNNSMTHFIVVKTINDLKFLQFFFLPVCGDT